MISVLIALAVLTPTWGEEADGCREEAQEHYERAVDHLKGVGDNAGGGAAGIAVRDGDSAWGAIKEATRHMWEAMREKNRGDTWNNEAAKWDNREIPGERWDGWGQSDLDALWAD